MIRKHLTYANLAATLALAGVLGGGGAYAASQIGSGDIKDNAVRSKDLRNRGAVRAIDVMRDTLSGRQLREQTLDASRFAPLAGSEPSGCDPDSATFIDCARTTLTLRRPARVLAIATGGQESQSGAARAICQVRIDDAATPLSAAPGEETTDNTSSAAANGFARTIVTPAPLGSGPHKVALACGEFSGDVRIGNPTVAAIAIAAP